MKRILLSILLAATLLTGCTNNRKPVTIKSYNIAGIEDVNMSFSGLTATVKLDLVVENPLTTSITLEDAKIILYKNGGPQFADFTLAQTATVEKNSCASVSVPLKASFSNPMAILSSGILSGKKIDENDFTIDMDLSVKAGTLSRKIQKSGVPLSQLKNMLNQEQ